MRRGLALLVVLQFGCATANRAFLAVGRDANRTAEYERATSAPTKLMIFAGPGGHHTYLGCLSCEETDLESVHNRYGNYGALGMSTSLFSSVGYGSRYSTNGPCNPYALDPPVIVDESGQFYGYLTINRNHPKRSWLPEVNAWIEGVCAAIP